MCLIIDKLFYLSRTENCIMKEGSHNTVYNTRLAAEIDGIDAPNAESFTAVVVRTALLEQACEKPGTSEALPDRLVQLAAARNACDDVHERRDMSKQLAHGIREFRRRRAQTHLEHMIHNGQGWSSLQQWQRRPRQKMHITGVKKPSGEVVHSRHDVVEVFATFYEALYTCDAASQVRAHLLNANVNKGLSVTLDEVTSAVALLKSAS